MAIHRPRQLLVVGHHDLDGIVSAAIAIRYLRERHPDAELEVGFADFHMMPVWPGLWSVLQSGRRPWYPDHRRPSPDGIAIVDFPATPIPDDAFLLYADHHPTAFENHDDPVNLQSAYARRASRGEPVFYRPGDGSCASVLIHSLQKFDDWETPLSLHQAAQIAHKVDTAGYTSAQEALDFNALAPRCDFLSTALSVAEAGRVALDLADGASLDEAMLTRHAPLADRITAETLTAIHTYREISTVSNGTALIDLTRTRTPRVKFAEFLNPAVIYSAQLHAKHHGDGRVTVSVHLTRSPWAPPLPPGLRHPDLGRIAAAIAGGGGHPFAAAFRVTSTSLANAVAQARSLVSLALPLLTPVPVTDSYASREPVSQEPRHGPNHRVVHR